MNIKAQFAGLFYPKDKTDLKDEVKKYLSLSEKPEEFAKAVIAPHAGYVYSGQVLAKAIVNLNPNPQNTVFIITSSHSHNFNGISVYFDGNYETPLGEIHVNTEIAKELLNHKNINQIYDAHKKEHSIEVILPFLQVYFNNDVKIIPIIIGNCDIETIKSFSDYLLDYFNDDTNCFIFSSDFSHFPSMKDAIDTDRITAEAIIKNDSKTLIETLNNHKQSNIKNLETSLCGATAILSMIFLTENKNYKYKIIDYRNSGFSDFWEKERVVGYYAIACVEEKSDSFITELQKEKLLQIARNSLEVYLNTNQTQITETDDFLSRTKCGAFVTLKLNNQLRGCLGRFQSEKNIIETIQELAISAATNDYRFSALTSNELSEIKIEISLLTPMIKIDSVDEIKLGKHGIYIKKGINSGTFLPEVATQTKWNLEEFLGHCSRDKANLGYDGWKNADIYIYETIKFSE